MSQPVSDQDQPQSGLRRCLAGIQLMPVVTLYQVEDAVPLANALQEAGLECLEFTLRTSAGLASIAAVRKALPTLRLAAGSVQGINDYHLAVAAGADFVVSPGSTSSLLDYGITAAVPLLPGVTTASELMLGVERGYQTFKFFPAEAAGGVAALSALSGPFPGVQFVPTGGISEKNAAHYLALPQVATLAGAWLVPEALIAGRDWAGIGRLVRSNLDSLVRGR